jgi:hypothetical protein
MANVGMLATYPLSNMPGLCLAVPTRTALACFPPSRVLTARTPSRPGWRSCNPVMSASYTIQRCQQLWHHIVTRKMLPATTMNDVIHGGRTQLHTLCDHVSTLALLRSQQDGFNLCGRQLRLGVAFSVGCPPFFLGILQVIRLCSAKQMGRIAARRIIAVVTNKMFWGYRAIRQNEGIPMGSFIFPIFNKRAIVQAARSLPFPATQITPQAMCTPLHARPKFLRSHKRHTLYLRHRYLLSSHMNIISQVERVWHGKCGRTGHLSSVSWVLSRWDSAPRRFALHLSGRHFDAGGGLP